MSQAILVTQGVFGRAEGASEQESSRMWSVRAVRSQQRRRRGSFGSSSSSSSNSSLRKSVSNASTDDCSDGESDEEMPKGIADLFRAMWISKISSSKEEVVEESKPTWKPRSSLDVSGHSFGNALQEELRKARQSCNGFPSPDQHGAANRKRHLAGLLSPKGGFSSPCKDGEASGGSTWWDDNSSAMSHSRCSSTSTCPPSPPRQTANLPPRAPVGGRRAQSVSRRCTGYRKEYPVSISGGQNAVQ